MSFLGGAMTEIQQYPAEDVAEDPADGINRYGISACSG